MSRVPDRLEDWTLSAIESVVQLGYFESRVFDFKETLAVGKDEKGRQRLRRAIAGFANSGGGFLVFGVRDARDVDPKDRIVGIDRATDVPALFGAQAATVTPHVEWGFLNPAIDLPSGRVVHVMQVHEGRTKPYGVYEEERWFFPKRTDSGIEQMSYEEMREAFRSQREFRRQLMLVAHEAERMKKHGEDLSSAVWGRYHERYFTELFRPAMFEAAVMQILPDIAGNGDLVYAIDQLRIAAAAADEEAAHLRNASMVATPAQSEARELVSRYFEDRPQKLAQFAEAARDSASRVAKLVTELLAKHDAA